MRRRKRLLTLVVLAVGAATLAGCGGRESQTDEVRAAIAKTRKEAAQFIYTDVRPDIGTQVSGVVEDDFRFKALVSRDATPAYEQVVHDDALAMRLLNPDVLPELVDRTRIDSADLETDIDGANVLQVLDSKRWVLDATGAPGVANTVATTEEDIGKDPVFDALTALDYVEGALSQAVNVEEWRSDALNPVYPRSEDRFPKPEDGSGVVRYDLRRGRLPALSDAGAAGGQQALPATQHFRKMAIYVKDGRIIQVLEAVEVVGKFVEDLRSYLDSFVEQARLPAAMVAEFEAMKGQGGPTAGQDLLEFLNTALAGLGGDPILARTMSIEFEQLDGRPRIELPSADVVQGNLEVMLAARAAAEGGDIDPAAPPEEPSDSTDVSIPGIDEPADGSEPAPDGQTPPGAEPPPAEAPAGQPGPAPPS